MTIRNIFSRIACGQQLGTIFGFLAAPYLTADSRSECIYAGTMAGALVTLAIANMPESAQQRIRGIFIKGEPPRSLTEIFGRSAAGAAAGVLAGAIASQFLATPFTNCIVAGACVGGGGAFLGSAHRFLHGDTPSSQTPSGKGNKAGANSAFKLHP